jgi:PAS domain S-box-containing protein
VGPERAQIDEILKLEARIAHLELENAELRESILRSNGLETYETQFAFSSVPSFIHHEGRIIYANAAALDLLRANSQEELLGRSPLDIIDGSFHDVVRQRIRALLDTQRPLAPLEQKYRRLDGTQVTVLATAWLIPYLDSHAIHVSLWDLSAQKEAERQLKSSLDLINSIIEGTPDPIFVKDLNGRYVQVNSAAARLAGCPRDQMIGRKDADLFPPPFLEQLLTVDRRVMATGVTEVVEDTLMEGGQVRVYLTTKSAWRDPGGQITGLVGVARDITDRKITEQELSRSGERLELALQAGRMGTWDYEIASGTLTWSDNHFRLFGLEPGSCVPTSELFTSRIHPADRGHVDAVIAQAMEDHKDYTVQYRVVWADKSVHWLEARGRIPVEDGQPIGTIGVVTDVTDRKRAEDRLREADKLESLGILAGGIAHDFNNLLTGIIGNASLIKEEALPGSEIAIWARSVVDASERAASLTQQMLAYSGRGHFVIEPVELSKEVAAITELLQASIPKHVTLQLNLGERLPQVEADRGQIQQVVMNLVLNAAEAVRAEAGTVQVRTLMREIGVDDQLSDGSADRLPAGEYVALEVQDDGHGMAAEVKDRIFEPFFTTKFTGRGLGLAAVLGIVRGHKGVIRVQTSPGEGTLFTVLFPPSTMAKDALPEAAAEPAHSRRGELVLVVDDEEIVRKVAVAALERRGYRTVTANNGSEAISLLQRRAGEISVVLLDMMMPVMGGVEALEHLRQIHEKTLFIATSGYPETDALKYFGSSIRGYIQKPYSASELVKLVEDVIEQDRNL